MLGTALLAHNILQGTSAGLAPLPNGGLLPRMPEHHQPSATTSASCGHDQVLYVVCICTEVYCAHIGQQLCRQLITAQLQSDPLGT